MTRVPEPRPRSRPRIEVAALAVVAVLYVVLATRGDVLQWMWR